MRPPRKLVATLTVYLHSLAPTATLPQGPGAAVFARECARCHRGEAASGPPVALDIIGTDRSVGDSRERGTGVYRVPSLRAVGDRRALFASGAVDRIETLLDPQRSAVGHRYGLSLDIRDRIALLAYLQAL